MDNEDDISVTLIAKSDQLNAADLIGGAITVKILDVKVSPTSDQPVSIRIDGNRQPYKPCKSMRRLLAYLYGNSSKKWIGHSLTLYCDPDVLWAGAKAGGIRVSHSTGITETQEVPLRSSKHKVIIYTIDPLIISLPEYSEADFAKNKESWKLAIQDEENKTTAAGLLKKLKSQFTLKQEQENEILALDGQQNV